MSKHSGASRKRASQQDDRLSDMNLSFKRVRANVTGTDQDELSAFKNLLLIKYGLRMKDDIRLEYKDIISLEIGISTEEVGRNQDDFNVKVKKGKLVPDSSKYVVRCGESKKGTTLQEGDKWDGIDFQFWQAKKVQTHLVVYMEDGRSVSQSDNQFEKILLVARHSDGNFTRLKHSSTFTNESIEQNNSIERINAGNSRGQKKRHAHGALNMPKGRMLNMQLIKGESCKNSSNKTVASMKKKSKEECDEQEDEESEVESVVEGSEVGIGDEGGKESYANVAEEYIEESEEDSEQESEDEDEDDTFGDESGLESEEESEEECGDNLGEEKTKTQRGKGFHYDGSRIICSIKMCGKQYKSKLELNNHLKTEHELDLKPCMKCGGHEYLNVIEHNTEFHKGPCRCGICNQYFCDSGLLLEHVRRTHADIIAYVCSKDCPPRKKPIPDEISVAEEFARLFPDPTEAPDMQITENGGYLFKRRTLNILDPPLIFEALGPQHAKFGKVTFIRPPIIHPPELVGMIFDPSNMRCLSQYRIGHLAAAANYRADESHFTDTFYSTNFAPMLEKFNGGVWKRLEEYIRGLCVMWKRVLVYTGAAYSDRTEVITNLPGGKDLIVPDYFFIVVCVIGAGGKAKVFAVLVPHTNSCDPWVKFVCPVKQVKALVGHRFFPVFDEDSFGNSNLRNMRYICKHCNEVFESVRDLAEHEQKFKANCDICLAHFERFKEYDEHMKGSHPCVQCRECGMTLHLDYLAIHEALHVQDLPVSCDQCDMHFVSEHMMEIHRVKNHASKTDYKCDECPKAFGSVNNLRSHKRQIHTERQKHKCDLCGWKFNDNNHLRVHVRVRHRENPEPCDMCTLRFSSKKNLRNHKYRKHEIKFDCLICKKEFNRHSELAKHMYVHNEEKTKCDICNFPVCRPTGLARHKLLHHPEGADVPCAFCKAKFKDSNCLVMHEKVVHYMYPPSNLRCDPCERVFSSRSACRKHKKHSCRYGEMLPTPKYSRKLKSNED